jgi:hypothetical protein
MHASTRQIPLAFLIAVLGLVAGPMTVRAGCGCDKPPPPRAVVRPFVGHAGQLITIFDDRLQPGRSYRVEFRSPDGTSDWSGALAKPIRDLADRQKRMGLEVNVPPISLGPAAITVSDDTEVLLSLSDEEFTVAPDPIELHEYQEDIVENGYHAAVGRDGTLYIALDVAAVTNATTFVAHGVGYPLHYDAGDVVIYNDQGFLMQILDPSNTGLFEIHAGDADTSDTLSYWRHEFATYKREHRRDPAKGRGETPSWHADGTPHVDHDHLVVAIRGTLPDGSAPVPGATPAFDLELTSEPTPR